MTVSLDCAERGPASSLSRKERNPSHQASVHLGNPGEIISAMNPRRDSASEPFKAENLGLRGERAMHRVTTLAAGLLVAGLLGCAPHIAPSSVPAGSPPPSPREIALQVDQTYQLLLTAVATAMPNLPSSAKSAVKTATDATTKAVLVYHDHAEACVRDAQSQLLVTAPNAKEACNPSATSAAEAVAWSQIGVLNGVLAANVSGFSPVLPTMPQ